MNIDKLIIESLSTFTIPCKYQKYNGKEDTYITYFEVNNFDDDYSDEENETEIHSLQIDLWSKNDVTQLKKDIKQTLKSKFKDVTYQEFYEEDTKKFHIAFRCYFYEERESELNGKN